jgi:NAD(P)-dependent dehydrogenase (short-subunit alcohol dehydrogenase family)
VSDRPLESLVAVVTGGGRGIGRAHCERLAAYGARVVVNDFGVGTEGQVGDAAVDDPAREVVDAIRAAGGEAVAHRGDVTRRETGEELLATALDTWGRCDIVIANAGFGRARMAFNLDTDDWDAVVGVHLRGTFLTAQPALRHWRALAKRDGSAYGRLLTTSTGLLLIGGAGQSNYAAAKAGVLAFTEAVATEMAAYGVTANVIMPGANTRLAQIGWRTSRAIDEEVASGAPSTFNSRAPEHVAELACYLASPAGGWISGQTFQVHGGTIEHVRTFAVDQRLQRSDRGYTLDELGGELTRLFGAGPRAADRPPPDWSKPAR